MLCTLCTSCLLPDQESILRLKINYISMVFWIEETLSLIPWLECSNSIRKETTSSRHSSTENAKQLGHTLVLWMFIMLRWPEPVARGKGRRRLGMQVCCEDAYLLRLSYYQPLNRPFDRWGAFLEISLVQKSRNPYFVQINPRRVGKNLSLISSVLIEGGFNHPSEKLLY